MYIEPELKDWLPQDMSESELIAAMKSFKEAAEEYVVSVAQAINGINEEAVYESKWRRDNEI